MKKQLRNYLMLLLSLLIPAALHAQTTTYGTGGAQNQQTRYILARIETKNETFRNEMSQFLNQDQTNLNMNRGERFDNMLDRFEQAMDSLRNTYATRSDSRAQIDDVLQQASTINRFVERNSVSYQARNQWGSIRNDLDLLARNYNVSWNWNTYPNNDQYGTGRQYGGYYGRGNLDSRITGTYRLNVSQSDNVSDVLNRTFGSYSSTQSETYRPNLERRLSSPDMIAIEKIGNRVTMASNLAPQVTFAADGLAKSEVNNRGRTVTTTATADRSGLSIRYQGERANDFTVAFTPMGNGQLRVVRTLYLENRNQTVSVASVYDKVDSVARWSMVNTNDNVATNNSGYETSFVIPSGTQLTAQIENNIGTRISHPGDRFTMRVTSPASYSGAIIEGHVANADTSGRLSGRANMSLEFDSIRMPDGRNYRFAGLVDSVQAANGQTVSVDNEGAIRDRNQTKKTVTRAGIGAVVGALIGAIAGGGQGAAIGATVGAGAGAGSVLLQGRDNIEIEQGSVFSVTASAPSNVGQIRY
jgi:hypothetical protein